MLAAIVGRSKEGRFGNDSIGGAGLERASSETTLLPRARGTPLAHEERPQSPVAATPSKTNSRFAGWLACGTRRQIVASG